MGLPWTFPQPHFLQFPSVILTVHAFHTFQPYRSCQRRALPGGDAATQLAGRTACEGRKSILARGNSQCKSPEEETALGTGKTAGRAGEELGRGDQARRLLQDAVRSLGFTVIKAT